MTLNEVLFIIVVFLANIIQAITGFAGTLLAMPASMKLIGVDEAKAILNVLGLLASLWIVIKDFKHIDKKQFKKIVVLMTIGIGIGVFTFSVLPLTWLLTGYGVMITIIALKKIFKPKSTISLSKSMKTIIVLMAGVIHGMFISGGALLVIYATEVFSEKIKFRATLSAVWLILNSLMLLIHLKSGYFDPDTSLLLVISIPMFCLAMVIGNWLHVRIKQELFLKLTYILLLVSGVLILK